MVDDFNSYVEEPAVRLELDLSSVGGSSAAAVALAAFAVQGARLLDLLNDLDGVSRESESLPGLQKEAAAVANDCRRAMIAAGIELHSVLRAFHIVLVAPAAPMESKEGSYEATGG